MKKNILFLLAIIWTGSLAAQDINNFVHPDNYKTGTPGDLGAIKKFGTGDKVMILLPGWGFDYTIFDGFIEQYQDTYSIYAVTFPGFGGTPAPPMPEDSSNFQDLQWTNGIIKGIRKLMETEQLSKPIIVSYFTYSNVIAMRLALDYPEEIERVIILSGMAKFTANYPAHEPRNLDQRIMYIEKFLAPQWFKTVNKETWDAGNFHADTFARDSVKAAGYWEMMSTVPIPIMIRYLCEYYCTDLSLEYVNLKVPTLVVIPSFTTEVLTKPETSYLTPFFHHSWLGARPESDSISIIVLTDTNAFVADDQPEKLYQVIEEFLDNKLNMYQVVR
ncbi:MAG: alpha/beta hydrolase [Cyclobacteriaceae bacterium]